MTALAQALALAAPVSTPRSAPAGSCAVIRAYVHAHHATCRRVDLERALVAQGFNANTVHTQVQAALRAIKDAAARLPLA